MLPGGCFTLRCSCPLAATGGVTVEELTVLVRPQALGWAVRAVSGCREAQHRSVILCKFLQTCHVSHMDTVLEVWSNYHRSNVFVFVWLPGEQLNQTNNNKGEKTRSEKSSG